MYRHDRYNSALVYHPYTILRKTSAIIYRIGHGPGRRGGRPFGLRYPNNDITEHAGLTPKTMPGFGQRLAVEQVLLLKIDF